MNLCPSNTLKKIILALCKYTIDIKAYFSLIQLNRALLQIYFGNTY